MKVKVVIHTLSEDSDCNGTMCEVFGTEKALHKRLKSILNSHDPDPDVKQLLRAGEIEEAWELWYENQRDPMDTYSIDEHTVEVEVEVASELLEACKAMVARFTQFDPGDDDGVSEIGRASCRER